MNNPIYSAYQEYIMQKVLITLFLSLSYSVSCFSSEQNKFTISGISSGGFMANQMATIFSSQFSGVGTVAGGFYYCAENYLQKRIKADAKTIGTGNLFLFEPNTDALNDSFNPFFLFSGADTKSWFRPQKRNPIFQSATCMATPNKANLPTAYLKSNAEKKLIDPIFNVSDQKVIIYHGKTDSVMRFKMQERLKEYYLAVGVKETNLEILTGDGNHNFPTDRTDGIDCNRAGVPYVGSCDLDLAGKILSHLFDDKIVRSDFNPNHIYVVDQTLDLSNILKPETEWTQATPSVAAYGYLYANDKCLENPTSCKLHVALHGCQMSDSFNADFQEKYQKQVTNYRIVAMRSKKEIMALSGLPMIEDKTNNYGLLKFVLDSGYINYGEANDAMILFPQTWITENNYPYNPHGCWDWFGWTGESYATNGGIEAKWLMDFINSVSKNPEKHILKVKPKIEMVEKIFPRK